MGLSIFNKDYFLPFGEICSAVLWIGDTFCQRDLRSQEWKCNNSLHMPREIHTNVQRGWFCSASIKITYSLANASLICTQFAYMALFGFQGLIYLTVFIPFLIFLSTAIPSSERIHHIPLCKEYFSFTLELSRVTFY